MLSSDPILETDAGCFGDAATGNVPSAEGGDDLVYSLDRFSRNGVFTERSEAVYLKVTCITSCQPVEQLYVEIRPGEINTRSRSFFAMIWRSDWGYTAGRCWLLTERWSAPDVTEEHYRRFHELYNVEEIYKVVQIAMNETPKKIEYQVLLNG